jgi:hypothetical protein
MKRKKWVAKKEITASLIKSRLKRKWQIALRRYIIEKNPSTFYAPYFGIDIENFRKWIEVQFDDEINWNNFSKKWQLDHIVPVSYFDFNNEEELKLCWNFVNIRIEKLTSSKNQTILPDVLAAKRFFTELYKSSLYPPCLKLVEKISQIELSETAGIEKQQRFLKDNKEYLDSIFSYSYFEFGLLNSGRKIDEALKEISFFKKFE